MGHKTSTARQSAATSANARESRSIAAEVALRNLLKRDAVLAPRLAILDALYNSAADEEVRDTIHYCSYLLQNSTLEKLESVKIVADYYRDRRSEVALSQIA